MSTTRMQRHCMTCGQPRLFEKPGPNHILHLLLTVFSGGLWIPMWVIITLFCSLTPFRCTVCGGDGRGL